MKKISILVPCYNESSNLEEFIKELSKQLPKLYKFSVIFIDDGSSDNTWDIIKSIKKKEKTLKIKVNGYRFLNNCGKETVIKFGLRNCKNVDSVIIIDADLQHPPKLIPTMIKEWENGYKIVNGVRRSIKYSLLRRIGSMTFNYLMKKIASINNLNNHTDFKLIDKKILIYLNEYKERIRYFKAIVSNLSIQQKDIFFNADNRKYGNSKFNLSKLFSLGFNAIFAYSTLPLKYIGILGIFLLLTSTSILIYMLFTKLFLDIGYSITTIFVVFNTSLFGFLISILGIISYYISIIYLEIISRPEILIDEKL